MTMMLCQRIQGSILKSKQDIDDEHVTVMDVTLEPGNEDQIASCHPLDGPVWKQIDDLQLRQEE